MSVNIPLDISTIGADVVKTCNARSVYAELGVKKDFSDWIKAQIKRAMLVEDTDYVVLPQKGVNLSGGRPALEYHLTIDAGKHVAMLSGTARGRKVREYFIDCERQASPTTPRALTLAADSVAAIILIGEAIAKVPGVKAGIAMAATLTCIQQNTGIETASMRLALPAANEGPLCSLNATNLGKLVGMPAAATNKRLQQMGLQLKNARGEWELTQAGAAWAESMPYSVESGHSGYQVLWNPAVAEKLRAAA
ncbi:MAG: hypothetical protein EON54_05280 [Alcaligenaceae bacterium]|nr:MAG: hypothetical protein EON54_05280 [Alcaligenaceae bacterium]